LAAAAPHAPTCIEDKGSALAVHHRLAAPAMQSLRRALNAACAHAGSEWAVLRGRQVLEVKPRTVSKARGVASLLTLPPFAGTTPIAFGDDLTDLDMFQAVQEHGGLRVAVGPRIAQRADLHLATPAHARAALSALREQLTRGASTAQAWSLLHDAAHAP
jgi:trehalose 6-phosphate phosphatase